MLQFERINISEGTDVNKTGVSKEFIISHYWFFKDIGYKFEQHVCNEILTMVCELEKIAILNVKDVEYRCVL